MICVTIGRGRHKTLQAEWKAAAEAGAEMVELRIDLLRSEPNVKRILADRPTPAIFTVRRGSDGGVWRGDEEKRQKLLREAILLGVDYVDLESDIAGSIPRYGKTKRIVSTHIFKRTPTEDELLALVKSSREKPADVVKIAAMAQSLADASLMLELIAKTNADGPMLGIAMGPLGLFTRLLGKKYGAPFTFAGFNPDRTFAPGMPLFQDLQRDYFYDQIDSETEIYAVIGDPIAQSLSPAIHNTAFRSLGLNKAYVPILMPEGRLKESLQELGWLDIKGYSITIPHKEAIVPMLSQADGAVERTASCNTVVVQNGKLLGYNTDYHAAMRSLEDTLGGVMERDASPLLDKQILLLGAGGVARSIASGAIRRGAGVTICNRHEERATALAEELGCRSLTWSGRAGTLCDILVNCTPVGMHPDVDDSPLPPAAFRPGMIVFDTIYHPENTMMLKLAREHDCITINGVDMFIRQAAAQFYLFTGQEAPADLMREVVRRKLGAVRT